MNILHITPHLGGGVGSVVLNWMMKDTTHTKHSIVSLDKNNNPDWAYVNEKCTNVAIYDACYFKSDFYSFLDTLTANADIVLVHYWNHPLLYDVLINHRFPSCRLIMWNHVSGLYPPYVNTVNDIDFCDKFVFTSPVSYDSESIKALDAARRSKLDVNWSTIGVESFKNLERPKHADFIVGLTGTVDFGKLNPRFIDLCNAVNIPDVHFVVCSGDSQEHLIQEAKEKSILDKFSFMGRVPSIVPYVAQFDVFGYPLQPQNFATCEQAIGEAMMAGAVPVVLNNPPESYIVKHMQTGIVAHSHQEYSKGIEYLYNNPDVLEKLRKNAQTFASDLYDIHKTIDKWYTLFDEEMKMQKRVRTWLCDKPTEMPDTMQTVTPEWLYVLSQGMYAKPFVDYLQAKNKTERDCATEALKAQFATNSMYKSNNKGSVMQYLKYFPDSFVLKVWAKIARGEE